MTKNNFEELAGDQSINTAKKALEENGFKVLVTENNEEALREALKLIPENTAVMTATSQTLEVIGLNHEINESGRYDAVKPKLMKMDRNTQHLEMNKMGAAPEYVIGSVQAVTEDGKILIASATGSQLASYVYGAINVIWVVSTKKIVSNLDDGIKRINEYILPLEDARALKAYGGHTSLNKILIVNKERPGRITIILVKENLGF